MMMMMPIKLKPISLCILTSYFRNGVIASLLLAIAISQSVRSRTHFWTNGWVGEGGASAFIYKHSLQFFKWIGRPGGVWSLGGLCRPGGCYEGTHLFDNLAFDTLNHY